MKSQTLILYFCLIYNMKNIFLLLVLCPFVSSGQYTFQKLAGKWQEQTRTDKKKEYLAFTDTLRMEIRPDGFMMVRHAVGATLTGEAEIKFNSIMLEQHEYEIMDFVENKLVIKDEDGIHLFSKKTEFTNAPVKKQVPGATQGEKDLSFKNLKGSWTCYKKTDPNFRFSTLYIKSIDVLEDKGNDTFTSNITFHSSDTTYSTSAFMYFKDNHILLSSEEDTQKVDVLKATTEELILQNGSVIYFLKQFGKRE